MKCYLCGSFDCNHNEDLYSYKLYDTYPPKPIVNEYSRFNSLENERDQMWEAQKRRDEELSRQREENNRRFNDMAYGMMFIAPR